MSSVSAGFCKITGKRESEEKNLDKEAVARLEKKLKGLAAEWALVLTGAPRPRRAS